MPGKVASLMLLSTSFNALVSVTPDYAIANLWNGYSEVVDR